MNEISPELALVDDALAARERARLPEPEDCLAPRPPAPTATPRALALLALPAEEERALAEFEPEPEDEHVPRAESEPLAPAVLRLPALAPAEPVARVELVEPKPEPTPELTEAPVMAAEEPVALVEPEPALAPEPQWAPDVEPQSAQAEAALTEPEPVAPARMPDWVAMDAPPESRRTRRKDRARERRDEKRPMRRRVAVAASWVVLCGFLASPLLAFIPSPNGERPTLAPDGVASVPDAGDGAGHVLRWEPVAKAAGYSVVFVNDGVRSDRWSQAARLRLPAGTEAEQLVTYEWFVYPAFREGAGYRYGPLVASGEVTMPRLAPTESS